MSEIRREILQLGHPDLRQPAQPINNSHNQSIQKLINEMLIQMEQASGVGIAAPQLGIAQQLIIIASRPTLRYPQAPTMNPLPMLNPQIVAHASTQEKGWEGCLSVPGIRGLVPRYTSITVDYLDRYGQQQQQTFYDFVARIFQHEFDHLCGIVFIDRVERTTELISEQEYQHQILSPALRAI